MSHALACLSCDACHALSPQSLCQSGTIHIREATPMLFVHRCRREGLSFLA